MYVIMVDNRDKLIEYLTRKGICCGIHFPIPLHLVKAYKHLHLGTGTYPYAEAGCQKILSIPMFPELTDEQINYISKTVLEGIDELSK